MGSGWICPKKFDKIVQMPSISSEKPTSATSSLSQSYKTPPIKPPLSSVQEDGFTVKRNADQYSSIWDYNAKVSINETKPRLFFI